MAIYKKLTDYTKKESFGSRLRVKRVEPLLDLVKKIYKKKGAVNIIDVGGTVSYWTILPDGFVKNYNVKIVLVNTVDNNVTFNDELFTFINADGCDLSLFEDKSFDITHSNSVIEHVGNWERKVCFGNETRRVSDYYFVQTPNFWFPIEPHCMAPFFHWLPVPLRLYLIMNFRLGYWDKAKNIDKAVRSVESAQLLTKKMLQFIYPDSILIPERFFLFTKSYIAISKNTFLLTL